MYPYLFFFISVTFIVRKAKQATLQFPFCANNKVYTDEGMQSFVHMHSLVYMNSIDAMLHDVMPSMQCDAYTSIVL